MHKLFSLDFLNKDTFDTDIFSGNSGKLVSKGDKVTPEILLKLYFKDIYSDVSEKQAASVFSVKEAGSLPEPVAIKEEKHAREPVAANIEENARQPVERKIEEKPEPEPEEFAEIDEKNLVFNEDRFDRDHAQDVYDVAVKIGKLLTLKPEDSAMLKEAAFYHDVGKAILPEEQLNRPGSDLKAAKAAFNYLAFQKNQPEYVAQTALKMLERYNCDDYPFKRDSSFNMPLHHIVSIADFYVNYYNKIGDKKKVCDAMLKLGYTRFNPYILHKFIYNMRISNE